MFKEIKKAVKAIKKTAKVVWKGVKRVVKEIKNLVTNETNERIKEDLYGRTVYEWGPEKLVEVALLTIGGAFIGAVASALLGIKCIPNKENNEDVVTTHCDINNENE